VEEELRLLEPLLTHLARLSDLRFGPAAPGAQRDVVAGVSIGLSLPARAAEADRERTARTLAQLDEEIANLLAKLRNPAFVDRAPAEVVDKTRRRLLELEERRTALGGPSST
jgi:valyl-tRNA synthetase